MFAGLSSTFFDRHQKPATPGGPSDRIESYAEISANRCRHFAAECDLTVSPGASWNCGGVTPFSILPRVPVYRDRDTTHRNPRRCRATAVQKESPRLAKNSA